MTNFKRTLPLPTSPSDSADRGPNRPQGRTQKPRPTSSRPNPSPCVQPGDWIAKGRAVLEAIEAAIRAPNPPQELVRAVERAHSALFLDGVDRKEIASTAHLCERAHDAIRKVGADDLERAIRDCASVLQSRLPRRVRRRLTEDDVVRAVRTLRLESIQRRAVTEATIDLLGWIDLYRGRAEEVVQAALRDYPGVVDE